MQRVLARAVVLLLVASGAAQQPLVETIEVRVTNIDVVVTDRSGNPVRGLTREDFLLTENGKPQTITNLYEVRPEAAVPASAASTAAPQPAEPPRELRQRRVVIFIDNYSIHPIRRNEVFAAIDRSLGQLLRDGDEAMVVTWLRGTHIVQPFTRDLDAVRRAIAAEAKKTAGGVALAAERDRARSRIDDTFQRASGASRAYSMSRGYSDAQTIANVYAEESFAATRQLVSALRLMLSTLAGVDGKKVMLYAGGELPERPGFDMLTYVEQLYMTSVRNVQPAIMNDDLGRNMARALRELAHQANADGVTMYMVDAGDRNALPTASARSAPPVDVAFVEETNTTLSMRLVASLTGGVAVTSTKNYDLALDTIRAISNRITRSDIARRSKRMASGASS